MKRWRMYATLALLAAVIAAIVLHAAAVARVLPAGGAGPRCRVGVRRRRRHPGRSLRPARRPGRRRASCWPSCATSTSTSRSPISPASANVYQAQLAGLQPHQLRRSPRQRADRPGHRSAGERRTSNSTSAKTIARSCGSSRRGPARCCRRRSSKSKRDESTHLPTWSGSPFDRENLGATLVAGTKLCQIGDPNRLGSAAGDRSGRRRVRARRASTSRSCSTSRPSTCTSARSSERGSETVKTSPPHLSSLHGGPLADANGPRRRRPAARARSSTRSCRCRKKIRTACCGSAWSAGRRSRPPPRTLWDRLYRYAVADVQFRAVTVALTGIASMACASL